MLHQTFLFLGQLWQLFEVSQILEFLRYHKLSKNSDTRSNYSYRPENTVSAVICLKGADKISNSVDPDQTAPFRAV